MSDQRPSSSAALNRPDPVAVGLATVEAGAWLAVLALAALSFSLAGGFGFTAQVDPAQLSVVREAAVDDGGFSLRMGVLAYALVGLVGTAGMFVPALRLNGRPALRVAAGAALAAVVCSIVLFFVLTAWIGIVTAAAVGTALHSVFSVLPPRWRKPWRSAGVPVVLLLIVTYGAQFVGGVGAGHTVLRWMAVLGCLLLLAGAAVLMTRRTVDGESLPTTGAFPSAPRMAVREAVPVKSAWACHFLFFVLGAVGVLAQPAVADLGFGQAGMAVIVCAVLLGWAVGFETGPTFAPGMSRTRLTAFALIASGVLMVAAGALTELSGKAVLSGAIAFLVGLGVRAQEYSFSRRVGAGLGMAAALALTALGVQAEIPLSTAASWDLTASEFAYEVVGLIALVAGVVALFAFGRHGIHGIGVDIVHAFRAPAARAPDHDEPAAADRVRRDGAPLPGEAASGGELSALDAAAGAPGAGTHGAGRGLFIAIEGGDGTGKSTQIHLLAEALRERGFADVVTTREPGGTAPGRQLRSVLLDGDGVTPRAEALVFAADRAHHVAALVRPIVERGGIVITDRYIDSSRAYQAAGRALGDEDIRTLSGWATEGLLPDLTVVLDADPELARSRTTGRGNENHLDREDADFHRLVRESFLSFAGDDPERYRVVDASGDLDTVAGRVLAAVSDVVEGRSRGSVPPPHVPDGHAAGSDAGEAETVVSPAETSAGGQQGRSDPGEAETMVHRAVRSATPSPASAQHGSGVGGPDLPRAPDTPQTPRPSSRERLRAQAEIERQARERLRAQRDGRHR